MTRAARFFPLAALLLLAACNTAAPRPQAAAPTPAQNSSRIP